MNRLERIYIHDIPFDIVTAEDPLDASTGLNDVNFTDLINPTTQEEPTDEPT